VPALMKAPYLPGFYDRFMADGSPLLMSVKESMFREIDRAAAEEAARRRVKQFDRRKRTNANRKD
jgi:hypothetical protein